MVSLLLMMVLVHLRQGDAVCCSLGLVEDDCTASVRADNDTSEQFERKLRQIYCVGVMKNPETDRLTYHLGPTHPPAVNVQRQISKTRPRSIS